MQKEPVCNPLQRFQCLFVVLHDRCIGEVGAGHDEHVDVVPEQQHMQRRIGKHHADISVFTEMAVFRSPLLQQDNRLARPGEDPLFGFGYEADLPRCFRIPAHDGKGLFIPLFPASKLRRDLRIVTATGQVEASEALYRHDLSGFQRVSCEFNGIALHGSARFIPV